MCKQIFISLLIIAIFNLLIGCYSSDLVTLTEYNQIKEEGKPNEIYVKTKDYREYHFSDSNFYIENDTLYGRAILLLGAEGLPFVGEFAFSEIETIQTENYGYMTVSIYQKIEAESGRPDEIFLTKYDNTKYHFMKNDYYTVNDTLFGKGKIIIDGEQQLDREKQVDRKIALSEIESIKIESLSDVYIALMVTSSVIAVALIVALLLHIKSIRRPF